MLAFDWDAVAVDFHAVFAASCFHFSFEMLEAICQSPKLEAHNQDNIIPYTCKLVTVNCLNLTTPGFTFMGMISFES